MDTDNNDSVIDAGDSVIDVGQRPPGVPDDVVLPAGYRWDDVTVWRNGTIAHKDSNLILVPPPPRLRGITKENASKISRERWQRYRIAASNGIAAAAESAGRRKSSVAAWAWIVEHQARLAATADGRSSTDAARFVGQAIGALGSAPVEDAGGHGGAQLSVSTDALLAVIERLAALRRDAEGENG